MKIISHLDLEQKIVLTKTMMHMERIIHIVKSNLKLQW